MGKRRLLTLVPEKELLSEEKVVNIEYRFMFDSELFVHSVLDEGQSDAEIITDHLNKFPKHKITRLWRSTEQVRLLQ